MNYQDFKSFYQSNILLFIILLFVLVYIILNWNLLKNGNYWGGDYIKTILITGIVFLISHMLITWDDTNDETTKETNREIVIPKYKFQSGPDNINKNIPINPLTGNQDTLNPPNKFGQHISSNLNQPKTISIPESKPTQPVANIESLNNKYKIVNKFNTNPNSKFDNFINNYNNDDDPRLSNQNIFISHKNSSKYGLKF